MVRLAIATTSPRWLHSARVSAVSPKVRADERVAFTGSEGSLNGGDGGDGGDIWGTIPIPPNGDSDRSRSRRFKGAPPSWRLFRQHRLHHHLRLPAAPGRG